MPQAAYIRCNANDELQNIASGVSMPQAAYVLCNNWRI